MVELLELLHDMLDSGLTWSTAIAIILGIMKITEGRRKRLKQAELVRTQEELVQTVNLIAATLNIHHSAPIGKRDPLYTHMKRSSLFLRRMGRLSLAADVKKYIPWKGGKHMRNDINWASLTITILGAFKIVLEAFKVDLIDDVQINEIANGVAAVATIVGVLMSHRKPPTEQLSEQEKVYL